MADDLFDGAAFELPQTVLAPRDFFCPRCFAPRAAACRTAASGLVTVDHPERVALVQSKRELLAALASRDSQQPEEGR